LIAHTKYFSDEVDVLLPDDIKPLISMIVSTTVYIIHCILIRVAGEDHPEKEVDKDITWQFYNCISYNNTDVFMVKVSN